MGRLTHAAPALVGFATVGIVAGSAASASLGVALMLRAIRHHEKATT